MVFHKDGSYSIGLFELMGLHNLSPQDKTQLANDLREFLSECDPNTESVSVSIYERLLSE